MVQTADVIIIGGDVHGASLAFHLAQRGLKPLVLEKKFVASGATGRSADWYGCTMIFDWRRSWCGNRSSIFAIGMR